MVSFAISETCTPIGPTDNQRRLPFTIFPMPGINTMSNMNKQTMSMGPLIRSQKLLSVRTTIKASIKPANK
ncbi:MAG: hypothetical protein LEGION0403_FIIPPAGN_02841 [Legionella sp.]